jgi:hypothetical protein
MISSRLGATSPYLHKCPIPTVEIGDAYLHIGVFRGAGEFASVAVHSLTLLMFVWFCLGWEPPHKYWHPAIEIGDAYSHIGVLRGAGEVMSVTTFSPELLTFA